MSGSRPEIAGRRCNGFAAVPRAAHAVQGRSRRRQQQTLPLAGYGGPGGDLLEASQAQRGNLNPTLFTDGIAQRA